MLNLKVTVIKIKHYLSVEECLNKISEYLKAIINSI